MRAFLRRIVPPPARTTLGRWLWRHRGEAPASTGYAILEGAVPPELLRGFADPRAAERQHAAFAPLLRDLRAGWPRKDFATLGKAVALTGLTAPRIVEVGCGSAWNAEVLERLGGVPVRYVGVDYSPFMLALARREHPERPFLLADATRLPLRDGAADILLSGTVLMHLLHYRQAVREARRVARRWCIFHTVPVLARRPTTLLRKEAYGCPTIEVIFHEGELVSLFEECGLRIRYVLPSIPYDLGEILGERTESKTYLCEVGA